LVMLIVNVIAVCIGVAIYHSVYSIAIAGLFPTIVAIMMTYAPLNKFQKFNFWTIYAIGYREVIIFVKEMKIAFLKK
jgi:hypothetical protein